MHSSNVSTHGMAVAPHHLASQSALAILREGGSAIEAMVAAAAAIAVVYPHMNGLGGDGFWLIVPPEGDPIAIDASGAAGSLATLEAYAGQRHIPHRGPQAALTVAGTVSGWDEALRISRDLTGRALPVARLLADAIGYAEDGIPVTASQAHATASKLEELRHQPGFSETWLVAGEAPRPGSRFRQPALAGTLRMLASDGLDSFYRGPLAERLAQGMAALGMPITLGDLQAHRARRPGPLTLQHQQGTLWNLAPPTQGLVSLAILGITDRLNDGRVMVYGSMGGDGQPQTQAALFTRYILQGVPLQESISRPRWLLGRTWGQSSDSLKLEGRFAPACIARLRELGHDVEVLADFSEAMGHAGAIVRHPNGLLEGATDPRSNGAAAGY
ncbi:TPA: hypothetical protein MH586_02850 [Klebsiella pneumoniae]|nr:hypothetical protein [Klebsiella pneumoniae]